MRKMLKLTLLTALLAMLLVSPALAKKAPVERTVVDGVTLAAVKQNTQVTPYYPATARVSKTYAEVIMAVEVDEKGKVSNMDVLSTSAEGLGFDVSARDAVKAWRFHPAIKDGEAIPSVSMIRLSFAPPTLGAPAGFVSTDTARRFYSTDRVDPTLAKQGRDFDQARAWVNPFLDNPAHHDARAGITGSDLPPCSPRRTYNECMYDRRDMAQFGGQKPEVHHNPVPGVR